MGTYRVTVQITKEIVETEEIEVYAPDQDTAIDRVWEKAEGRPDVKKIKLIDVGFWDASSKGE